MKAVYSVSSLFVFLVLITLNSHVFAACTTDTNTPPNVTCDSSNDTFSTGGGGQSYDNINAGDGANTINVDSGDDVESIDGGVHADTLNVDDGNVNVEANLNAGTDNVHVSNGGFVETLTTGDDQDTVTVSDDSSLINSANTGGGSDTVLVESGGAIGDLVTESGNDLITVTGQDSNVDTLSTGTGQDIVSVEDGGAILSSLDTGDDIDLITVSGTDSMIGSALTGLGNDIFRVMDGGYVGDLQTQNGDDQVFVSGADSMIDIATTGLGNDTVRVEDGGYIDSLMTEDGDDQVTVNGQDSGNVASSIGTADTGSGQDTVLVEAGGAISTSLDTGDDNDSVTVTGTDSMISTASTGLGNDIVRVDDGGHIDSLMTEDGNDQVTVSGQDSGNVASSIDTASTGSGQDTVLVAAGGAISTSLDTGDDSDSLTVTGANSFIGTAITGAGSDTVLVNNNGHITDLQTGADNDSTTIASGGNLDDLDMGDGNDGLIVTGVNSQISNVANLGNGNDSARVEGSGFINTLNMGDGVDTTTVTGAGSAIASALAGAGDDRLIVVNNGRVDAVDLGSGDDRLSFDPSANFSQAGAGQISGGSGNNDALEFIAGQHTLNQFIYVDGGGNLQNRLSNFEIVEGQGRDVTSLQLGDEAYANVFLGGFGGGVHFKNISVLTDSANAANTYLFSNGLTLNNSILDLRDNAGDDTLLISDHLTGANGATIGLDVDTRKKVMDRLDTSGAVVNGETELRLNVMGNGAVDLLFSEAGLAEQFIIPEAICRGPHCYETTDGASGVHLTSRIDPIAASQYSAAFGNTLLVAQHQWHTMIEPVYERLEGTVLGKKRKSRQKTIREGWWLSALAKQSDIDSESRTRYNNTKFDEIITDLDVDTKGVMLGFDVDAGRRMSQRRSNAMKMGFFVGASRSDVSDQNIDDVDVQLEGYTAGFYIGARGNGVYKKPFVDLILKHSTYDAQIMHPLVTSTDEWKVRANGAALRLGTGRYLGHGFYVTPKLSFEYLRLDVKEYQDDQIEIDASDLDNYLGRIAINMRKIYRPRRGLIFSPFIEFGVSHVEGSDVNIKYLNALEGKTNRDGTTADIRLGVLARIANQFYLKGSVGYGQDVGGISQKHFDGRVDLNYRL